ncbi:YppG family protein [Halobacillus amylolyticus]|uniref:YppG family protein n=1 Tax=Halobacillus amylolyticus TaxID=2932259 RepID=A0ABY4H652_9BACI|nr:YppG family protein [Halobacillus amylolyticus]UOR10330.1 YppG family protein [Halobacillus amylolyticus]
MYYYPYYPYWQTDNRTNTASPYYNYYYPYTNFNAAPGTTWNQGMYTQQYPYTYGYGYPGYNEAEPAAGQKSSVVSYFQDEQGQLDFDKMMSTTGQVVQTIQQVSPIVKGIGSFVKGMR